MTERLNEDWTAYAAEPEGDPPAAACCGCVEARPAPAGPWPQPGAAVAAVVAVEDPLARAAAATRLLEVLDAERLEVVRVRREAVAAAGPVSVRRLAGALGLSVTAASDVARGATGRPRRRDRDVTPGRARTAASPAKAAEPVPVEGSDPPE